MLHFGSPLSSTPGAVAHLCLLALVVHLGQFAGHGVGFCIREREIQKNYSSFFKKHLQFIKMKKKH